MSAARRSGRPTKQTALLNVGAPTSSSLSNKNRSNTVSMGSDSEDEGQADHENLNDENEDINFMNVDDVDDDDDDDDVFRRKKGGKKAKVVKRTKGAGKAKSSKETGAEESSNLIFAAIKHPQSTQAKLTEVANQWVDSYKKNKLTAVIKLLNCVLFCAGVKVDAALSENDSEVQDLEALDAEEMQELLQHATKTIDAVSPLTKSGSGPGFRKRFGMFFNSIVSCIFSKSTETDVKKIDEELKSIIEPFAMCSSFNVANYRDAFSDASLVMAASLVSLNHLFSDSEATQNRLLKAEADKMGNKPSEKHKTMSKQIAVLSKKCAICKQCVEEIFASVFVHRSKDINDHVRAMSMTHLGELIMAWPEKYLNDDFLKYIGWNMTDPSSLVRRETASALLRFAEYETLGERLQEFVTRFHEKMINMAASDKDPKVCKTYAEILSRLHEKGLLDDLEDEELNVVDQVVFDPTAAESARIEALLFLMSHTTGFDDEEEDEDEDAPPKSKGRGKGKGKQDESKALVTRQKHAVQLETLTEFVEFHVKDPMQYDNGAMMLTDVCLCLDKMEVVVRDWSTMTALLLKESDAKIAVSLRPTLSAILLRMFVVSAERLATKIDLANAPARGKSSLTAKASPQDIADWRLLSEVLQKDLAKLLKRFSDDHANLSVLTKLLCCMDFGENTKLLKPLLKALEDILDTATAADEKLVANISNALRRWTLLGEQCSGVVEPVMVSVLKGTWKNIQEALKELQKPSSSTATKKGKGKKSSQSSQSELDDAIHMLNVSISKQLALWKVVDCRSIAQLEMSEVVDELVEVADCVLALGQDKGNALKESLAEACISCSMNACEIVFNIMLWCYRDAFQLLNAAKEQKVADGAKMKSKKKAAQGGDESALMNDQSVDVLADERLEEYESAVAAVLDVRAKLVDALLTWMLLGQKDDEMESDDDSEQLEIHIRLQRKAFQLTNDLRCLFPAKDKNVRHLEELTFAPTPEVLSGLRRVFELEGKRAAWALSQVVEDDDDDQKEHPEILQHILLASLTSTIVFDTEHLNRRQAAAILAHLLDKDDRIVAVVKELARKLKHDAPTKYLEVQMVALKSIYTESVAPFLAAYLQASSGEADDDYVEERNARMVEQGRDRVMTFAKAFAENWGVRLPMEAAQSLVNFFKVAIDFAMEDPSNYCFVEPLSNYFRFISKDSDMLEDLSDHLEMKIAEVDGLAEEIANSSSLCHAVLKSFQKMQLPKGQKGGKKMRLSLSAFGPNRVDDAEDEEGQDEDVFSTRQPKGRAKAKTKPKAKPKAKVPMMPKAKTKAASKAKPAPKKKAIRGGKMKRRGYFDDEEESEEEEEEEEEAVLEKTIISDKTRAKKKPVYYAEESEEEEEEAVLEKTIISDKTRAKKKQDYFDEDEEEEEEEEEEELEKTLISDKTRVKTAPMSGSRSNALKLGLSLESMSDVDEDEEMEIHQREEPHQPAGSKRSHAVISETQEEALEALNNLPVRRRYR